MKGGERGVLNLRVRRAGNESSEEEAGDEVRRKSNEGAGGELRGEAGEKERARYVYTERTDIVFQIGIRGIGLLGSK